MNPSIEINNTLSLILNKELSSEEKVNYAELLNNVALSTLQTVYVSGIEQKEIRASEAFQTEIIYKDNSVEIAFNPKNNFFYGEVNKVKDIDKLFKIAEINFGFFSKIALKCFAKFSTVVEDKIITKSREVAAQSLIKKNHEMIMSMLGLCLYTGAVAQNSTHNQNEEYTTELKNIKKNKI